MNKYRIDKRLQLNSAIIEEVYSVISEIDGVKNALSISNSLSTQSINNLTRSVIVTLYKFKQV